MANRSSKKVTPAVQVTPEVETKPIIFETADVDQIITDILSQPCDKVGVIDFEMFLTRFIVRVIRLLDGVTSAPRLAAEMEVRELLKHLDEGFHPMTFIEDLNAKLTKVKFKSPTYYLFNPQSTEEIPKMNPEETKSQPRYPYLLSEYQRLLNGSTDIFGPMKQDTVVLAGLLFLRNKIKHDESCDTGLRTAALAEIHEATCHIEKFMDCLREDDFIEVFNRVMKTVEIINDTEGEAEHAGRCQKAMSNTDTAFCTVKQMEDYVKSTKEELLRRIGELWEAMPVRNDQFTAEYQRQQLKGLMRQPGTAYGQVGVPITDYPQGYPYGDVYGAMLESQKRARDMFYQGRSDNTVNLTSLEFNEICRDALGDAGTFQAGQDAFTAHSIGIANRLLVRFVGVYPVTSQLIELVTRLQHQAISRIPYANMGFFAGLRQLFMDHVKSLKIDESTPLSFQSRPFIPR